MFVSKHPISGEINRMSEINHLNFEFGSQKLDSEVGCLKLELRKRCKRNVNLFIVAMHLAIQALKLS